MYRKIATHESPNNIHSVHSLWLHLYLEVPLRRICRSLATWENHWSLPFTPWRKSTPIRSTFTPLIPLSIVSAAQSTITIPCTITAYSWNTIYMTTTTSLIKRTITQNEIYISSITTTTPSTSENFLGIPATQLVCGFTTTEITGLQTRTLVESSVGLATVTKLTTSVATPASCTSFVVLTTTVTAATVTETGVFDFRSWFGKLKNNERIFFPHDQFKFLSCSFFDKMVQT